MSVSLNKNRKNRSTLVNSYPFYSPRFWNGLRFRDALRVLGGNCTKIHPLRWPLSVFVLGCSILNSGLSLCQTIFYGKRIRETKLEHPPIFVLGHWRSGTTFLHELLCRDERLGYSSTYDCFCPHHFLVSRWFLGPIMRMLMPVQRPMDNMGAGAGYPQEDEFALCALNIPTPYWRIAFCNERPSGIEFLDLENCDAQQVTTIQNALTTFYKAVTLRDKKQLILKSPTHTGRIASLSRWFPGSKFIHISRNPYEVVPSTMRLWRALDQVQSFQIPNYSDEELLDYVFQCFTTMYDGYLAYADQLPPDQLIEIKYEELVRDPMNVIESVYSQLELPAFEVCEQSMQQMIDDREGYQPTTKPVSRELQELIDAKCADYVERFGYKVTELAAV